MFQSIVQDRLSGSTTPHLYQRDIAELSVLLPPLEKQKILVAQIWSAFEHQEEIQVIAKQKIELFESLRNAFLSKSLIGAA
jgi:type I restriction enzyme S subunit